MAQSITWKEEQRDIDKLQPYHRNPRTITKEQYQKLKENIEALGYHQRIIINTDNTIAGGHQRLEVLKEMGVKKVNILVPNRKLTDDEFRRLLVTDNLQNGLFDWEIIASDFEPEELVDWGMPEYWLGLNGGEDDEKESFSKESNNPDKEEKLKECPNCGEQLKGKS